MNKPAGMKRVPINPPRGHDPLQHQVVGEVHSWDPPKKTEVRSVPCVSCGNPVHYVWNELGPQMSGPPKILCDNCYAKGVGRSEHQIERLESAPDE